MPKTKIVCTIGPSSESREMIEKLILSGMNVARLNFSHGTHEEHGEKIKLIRSISEQTKRPVAILQDLCGPKIRVGEVVDSGIRLEPGQSFTLTSRPGRGSVERVSVSYQNLPKEVTKGDRILLADGMMELVVERVVETEIHCTVITGGILTSHKGINLPTGTIKVDALTDKDRGDLQFGLDHNVDYIAMSFVRTAQDIQNVKQLIADKKKNTPVIAKIEKHEALENIEDIIRVSDGIMVARGDLGVETPLENVPMIQKMLVHKANAAGKPVIIATQMLRSMVNAPRPTRAEATDVANGVMDGTDAVMLSEETAMGNYPVEAVQYMARIAEKAEGSFPHDKYLRLIPNKEVSESVAHVSCVLADHLDAPAIIATTRSGHTAMEISRFKPKPKLIALSPDVETVRRLCLFWGCIPRLVPETKDTDERIETAIQSAIETGEVHKKDTVVITSGHPAWVKGTTNMLKVISL